jgi:hypothetical protein
VSPKGAALRLRLDDFFERDGRHLVDAGLGQKELASLTEMLNKLERFWATQTDPQLRAG